MEQEKVYTVIGLMSGTSTDGVDAALLRTDGVGYVERIGGLNLPYEDALRKKIKAQFGKNTCDIQTDDVAREITLKHVEAVKALMAQEEVSKVDLIGFHGQTIYHAPDQGRTIQIGDADLLAQETGIDVVYDFRSADVNA
ncbi:MAG: anhydro-N-acetylmuramic acid kinase, partial [Bdellovibrionales bacterium]